MRREFDEKEFEASREDPEALEGMYRQDRRGFTDFITRTSAGNADDPLVGWWAARLNYRDPTWQRDLGLALALGLACWIPLRVMLGAQAVERLIPTYLSAIFFAFWGAFLLGREGAWKRVAGLAVTCALLAGYFAALRVRPQSQSVSQAIVHGYALLWLALYFLIKPRIASYSDRDAGFLETTGEAICWSLLLGAAGAALSGITVGLFNAIKLDIAENYMLNAGSLGAVLIPFIAVHLSGRFADFRMSVVIARIVRPLASIAIVSFIIVSLVTGNRPYEDRSVFILGNIVLLAMIALVFFSTMDRATSRGTRIMNIVTAAVALAFDAFILSATLYRIFAYGLTPNKLAVLGMNLLLAAHVAWLLARGRSHSTLMKAFAPFMSAYLAWTVFVIFVMPALFGYR